VVSVIWGSVLPSGDARGPFVNACLVSFFRGVVVVGRWSGEENGCGEARDFINLWEDGMWSGR
jgi:hypothetical protein